MTQQYPKTPTTPPHIVVAEMVEVGKKYGYQLQYGIQLSYWVNQDHYIVTVPEPARRRGER